jgi:hypothetical protein
MEIDYENDWSGECRIDPDDGNAYVLRAIGLDFLYRYVAMINDIFGGHAREVSADEWLKWPIATDVRPTPSSEVTP